MSAFEILKEAWGLREGAAVFTTVDKAGVFKSVVNFIRRGRNGSRPVMACAEILLYHNQDECCSR